MPGLSTTAWAWWIAMRSFDRRQRRVSAIVLVGALLVTGLAGQTLPGINLDRIVPLSWWSFPTWIVTSALLALIAATFVRSQGKLACSDRPAAAGSGLLGLSSTAIMACPVCNPLAIPFFGSGGVLSILTPDRGWLALASIVLLLVTLGMRLRTLTRCPISPALTTIPT